MFALLSHVFSKMTSHSDVPSNDTYLDSSADLADLERRMRQIDEDNHAYSLSFCGSISRGNH